MPLFNKSILTIASAASGSDSSAGPANPFAMGASIPENTIMYLSTGNPHRHAKLSTFPDNVKAGFYFIENKYMNNQRYQEATDKALIAFAKEEAPELKKETSEALKSVKSAWNALSNVNLQVKNLQNELEKNQDNVQQMKYMLHEIQNGNPTQKIPSDFFVSLLEQFETRLSQYKKRIDEIEGMLDSSLEKDAGKLTYAIITIIYRNGCRLD